MSQQILHRAARIISLSATALMLAGLLNAPGAEAQDAPTGAVAAIPPGTILPVRLNSSLSSSRTKPGQVITARIMQDVPLANGEKIPAGTKVIGHVVDVSSTADNTEQISLQFDKLISSGQTTAIKTNLRALAGFAAVTQAGVTTDGPVSLPLATQQVGGDTAFSSGGEVDTADGVLVGKSVKNGVLVQPRANTQEGRDCRGPIANNTAPQAMWVFSSDSCGTYGISDVRITHGGKTEPLGVIVLTSVKGQFKLRSGAGMLLRVQ